MATIIVGTNSYATEAELITYATDRGITISGDTSVLLIKAMDMLEVQKYIGYKTDPAQALQFPRVLCGTSASNYYPANMYPANFNYGSCDYDSTIVPDEIKKAQIVAALLIESGEDIQANLTQTVKREKVDVIEVEYMDNSSGTVVYTQLNSLLSPFIANQGLRTQRV